MIVDLIIKNANELLTIKGKNKPRAGIIEMNDLGIIKNGAIAILNKKIVEVDTTENILKKYSSEKIIDAKNKVVMPGFVDPHSHPVFFDTRENEFEWRIKGQSYINISQNGGGIRQSIKGVRKASEEILYDLSAKRIANMIKNGTTTLEAKSGYGLSTESELKMLRVIRKLGENLPIDIIPTFLGAHEFPEEYKNNHRGYLDILENEMLPEIKKNNLAKYVDIFTEEHVFSIKESREYLNIAKKMGFKIRMHADEIQPIGGAELAGEIGAISADHLGAASDKGIEKMRDNDVIATLLPGTIFSLGMKSYARARTMIDKKLPIALATDYNPGSCNCDNMQMIITLSTLQMKMSVAEAIVASTINAAFALELGETKGSLESEKYADILIMDMPSYQFLPYHFGSNNVEIVIKNGEIIYRQEQVKF